MNKPKHLKRLQILMPILFCGWTALIFFFSLQSGTVSAHQSGHLVEWLIRVVPLPKSAAPILSLSVRKLAHLTEYAILGLTGTGVYCYTLDKVKGKPAVLGMLLAGLTVAIIDEQLVQRFLSSNRGPAWTDVLIDLAGYSLAFLATQALFCRKRQKGSASKK